MTTTRRRFLALATATAAASRLARAQSPLTGTLSIDPTQSLHKIPADYTGLSYESAQLANPAFFSAQSKQLIALFRELSPSGVLRIGGGSSEYTTYSEADPTAPPPFETFGPDTSHTTKSGTTTTALALRNLRDFCDATNWNCLYGLNLGQGTKENAAVEAEAASRILGSRLLALQIGNEPDSFRNRFRPATYSPADFLREWNEFHDAIRARVPNAKFAGPDISNKLPYLTAFAAEAPQHPDVTLLTGHYYAMGPAGNPAATLENLLLPDPKLTTLKQRDLPIVLDAMRSAHLPFRLSEANSCWNGGQPGASDTHASALWCADAMLRFATLGFSGINLHGGGNGVYAPIVGAPSTGFTCRPEFFGVRFAQSFAGTTLVSSHLETTEALITAYASQLPNGQLQSALINKTDAYTNLRIAKSKRWAIIERLTAPSLAAKDSTTLANVHMHVTGSGEIHLPAHTALRILSV